MMNRQIRVEIIIGTVKVSLLVAQSKFKPYKHEVCRSKAIRQGRTQEGADGAETPPPEMLNMLGVFYVRTTVYVL